MVILTTLIALVVCFNSLLFIEQMTLLRMGDLGVNLTQWRVLAMVKRSKISAKLTILDLQ
ncbi:hypothetical protein C9J21_00855 [Photobacterium phosphoreum]|nr:hypothetical protein C9J21_00855 [Photobacterium phosphoreum]